MSTEPIHWSDEYKIGNQQIDSQHEYFASLINRLAQTLPTAGITLRGYLITFLSTWFLNHTAKEDREFVDFQVAHNRQQTSVESS